MPLLSSISVLETTVSWLLRSSPSVRHRGRIDVAATVERLAVLAALDALFLLPR